MSRILIGLLGISSLTGCAMGSPEGIWMIQLPYGTNEQCGVQVSHNYTEGQVVGEDPVEEEEWSEEGGADYSDMVFFAQIAVESKEHAVLVITDTVWPGARNDEGEWVFSWESFTEESYSAVHESGFVYTEVSTASSVTRVTMNVDGEIATGTWRAEDAAEVRWTESDEWAPNDVGTYNSSIPSGTYLETEDGDWVDNVYDEDDCEGDECRLTVVDRCADTVSPTMTRVGYDEEGSYAHVEDASRGYGG